MGKNASKILWYLKQPDQVFIRWMLQLWKSTMLKKKPSITYYHGSKNFCNDSFLKVTELLLSKLCDQQIFPFKILEESVNITLAKHPLLKKRYVRVNPSPLMNKKLSKEIM